MLDGSCRLSYLSDKYIVVWQGRQGDIFIFSRNGKNIHQFNHRGQGSREYNSVLTAVFDEKNEEIFVVDDYSTCRIQVYTLTGEYRRTLSYSNDLMLMSGVYNFDDETLLAYDENGIMRQEYSENPYLFLSKKDGSIISVLDINLPKRYSNAVIREVEYNGQKMQVGSVYNPPNTRYYGQDFIIADNASDTIYKLTRNIELTPLLILYPTVHSSEPRTVCTPVFTADRFTVLQKTTYANTTNDLPLDTLIYDFKTGETNKVTFINEDFPSAKWAPYRDVYIPQKNVAASIIQITELYDAYQGKQLRGDLEKLVATLDEEDNPLVMIVKFK